MIRSLLIVLTLIISFNTFAATTKAQAVQIYYNIIKANNFWIYPQLRFSNSKEMNASADMRYITINQGMLDKTNVSELALVIGHEFGHFKLLHMRSTPSNEFAADKRGYYYASKAGYNAHKGKQVFKKFKQRYSKTHPHPRDRFRVLP